MRNVAGMGLIPFWGSAACEVLPVRAIDTLMTAHVKLPFLQSTAEDLKPGILCKAKAGLSCNNQAREYPIRLLSRFRFLLPVGKVTAPFLVVAVVHATFGRNAREWSCARRVRTCGLLPGAVNGREDRPVPVPPLHPCLPGKVG